MLLLFSTPCFALKDVRSIPTRDGITLDFLVRGKESVVGKTVLILFPGGNGANMFRLQEDGIVRGNNFLVRTSKNFAQEFTAVIVDVPSDHKSGMDDDFRKSPEHAADIAKLIDTLAAEGGEKFYLVGTSRGTLSVASLAAVMQHPKLKGIVLTSSLEYAKFMRWVPLDKIKLPVLMVHHSEDACKICDVSEAKRTCDVLNKSTTVDFVEVTGGDLPKSGPCEALSPHGYYGVEEKAVQPIIDWIRKH
jgi:hypothetical protein